MASKLIICPSGVSQNHGVAGAETINQRSAGAEEVELIAVEGEEAGVSS